MTKIEVILISGRTAKQGIGLEEGKSSDSYFDSVNHIMLSPDDVETLGIKEKDRVRVTTATGKVTVNWVTDKNLDPGLVFFPYGPWANQVYGSGTGSTGMPVMKGIAAIVEKGKGKVLTLEEVVNTLREDA
ncbi:tRNA CCA-pyrophosphorylase [Candidatus Bathyarchaeota archaeon]|jgi:formylmethanofuran dehydrogenase subunit D|nr:tRNA CCA-pyrophosphorylase [Candidatus Bathyarchaeota archaeon]MBT4319127.1 tRNA CCA-pyrophosphorylase [Candidatus Bathyarchaeota archaeon]MBT4423459.1 tRNA CCA-pyrophosphorylase [Candidatus Bathyarchaeota archaeon]MBT6603662.1 tRNA CCA-pyrophosphorylase [Candidatus Bathyarchaeota archaeon]MBT7186360.1 tRNA CCA-pyrophosphorylase [Candidatus Bathyarchaeota archaeon]